MAGAHGGGSASDNGGGGGGGGGGGSVKMVDELVSELAQAEESRSNTDDQYFNAAGVWHLPNLDDIR